MENKQNDFKFSKSLLGKLLAIFSFVLAVFSLILYCVAYLNSSSINMSDTIKALYVVSCITIIIATGIFTTYYLFFRHKKNYDFIISVGLIILCVAYLITIISTFVSLADEINKTSKYIDVSPKIVEALASIVIPVLTIVLFSLSAYYVFKKKPNMLAVFTIIPAVITLLEFISVPMLTALTGSALGDGIGKFLEFFALCEASVYCCLFVLGLDLSCEYKKNAEADASTVEASLNAQGFDDADANYDEAIKEDTTKEETNVEAE